MNTVDDRCFLPPHGNYEELLSYQKAEVVYDLTYRFCRCFWYARDRTVDQMVQAALRQTDHRRRPQGGGYVERDGTQVDLRSPIAFEK